MNPFHLASRARQFKRYRAIAQVLFDHGLGFLIDRFGLTRFLSWPRRVFGLSPFAPEDETQGASLARPPVALSGSGGASLARHLALALTELGPTFIKFGQLLSTRPDLLPEPYLVELAKLRDSVPPAPFAAVRSAIEEEFHRPVSELFASLDETPLGSASIAQVHRATLASGEPVVVKVRRAGVTEILEGDIEVLYGLASMVEKRVPEARFYDPTSLVDEFARAVGREIDFSREATSTSRMKGLFAEDPTVAIPRVIPTHSGKSVLTVTELPGHRPDDQAGLARAGVSCKDAAANVANAFFRMVFEFGLFHGDPHPGNLIILPDGRAGFLDFGLTGRLTPDRRERMVRLFLGLATRDADRIVRALSELGVAPGDENASSFLREIDEFLDDYYGRSLAKIEFGHLIGELVSIASAHRVRVPAEFSLLSRAILALEGVGRALDPAFDAAAFAQPMAERLASTIFSGDALKRQGLRLGADVVDLVSEVPARVRGILKKAERGELSIDFRHVGLESLIREFDSATNRLSVAMILSAIVIGSSFLINAERGPVIHGMPLFGIVGFVTAGLLGLFLVISVLRSGRL